MAAAAKPCRIFSPDDQEPLPPPVVDSDDTTLCKNLVEEFSEEENNKMEVFLRIRPFTPSEQENGDIENCVEIQPNKEEVILKAPKSSATYRNNPYDSSRLSTKFTFTKIFGPSCNQKEFYGCAVEKSVKNFVGGNNCLVFAYGATNSGKTYTVQGTKESPGVIPSSLKVIFASLKDFILENPEYKPFSSFEIEKLNPKEQAMHLEYKEKLLAGINEATYFNSYDSQQSVNLFDVSECSSVSKFILPEEMDNSVFLLYVSFAEIYNEQLFDLLSPFQDVKKRPKLNLFQDSKGYSHVRGLTKIWVTSVEETQKLLAMGRKNLHIAATKLNEHSSRSHCIFTIYLIRIQKATSEINETAFVNHLSFCDLAGSERVVKTKNTGERLKEAGSINTSLMVLGRCIDMLKSNQSSTKEKNLVPYRDSKLTQLFKSFFNGQGKAAMIVNIAPNPLMFDDTLKVLKFSALAKQVITKDQTEKSILNFTSSISERLTSFWVKSNRRWSSIAQACPKQSTCTIPEAQNYVAEMEKVEEGEECDDFDVSYGSEDDDELDIQELLDDIKSWEEKSAALESRIKDLERENANIEEKTKNEAFEFFQNHIKNIEENHKEQLKNREERFTTMLNKRTNLLENYIAELKAKNGESQSEDESEDEESPDLVDKSMQVDKSTCELSTSVMSFDDDLSDSTSVNMKNKQLQKKIEEMSDQNVQDASNLLLQNAELKTKIDQLQSQLVEMSKALETERENSEALLTQLDESNSRTYSAHQKIEQLQVEIDALNRNAQLQNEKSEDIQNHNDKLEGELRDFKEQLACQQKRHTKLQDKLRCLESVKEQLAREQSQNTKLEGELQDLKEELAREQSHNDKLDGELRDLKEQLACQISNHKKFEGEMQNFEALKKEFTELEKQLQDLKLKLTHEQSNNNKLEMELRGLKDIKEELACKQNEYTKLEEDLKDLKGQLTRQQNSNTQLEEKLKTVKEKLVCEKNCNSELKDELRKFETVKKELSSQKEPQKISELEHDLKEVKKQLAEKEIEFDKLTDIFLEKCSENNDLTEKLEKMEKEEEQKTSFEKIIKDKDTEIDVLREKLNKAEENERKLKVELDDLENFQRPAKLKPGTAAKARRTRSKKMKLEVNTSTEDSSSENPSQVPAKLEASRSPLAVLGSMMEGSPIYNSIKKTVEYSIEKVSNAFTSKSPVEPLETTSTKRSSRRRLYTATEGLLYDEPTNDPSPLIPAKRMAKSYSLRRKTSKK